MLGYNAAMNQVTMTFDEALQWAYSKRAIIRFFESNDTEARFPTVRVVVVASNLEDRYSTVHEISEGQSVQDAMLAAIATVKDEYEAKETDLAAQDRRKSLRAVQ